jgi:hypothetical protein
MKTRHRTAGGQVPGMRRCIKCLEWKPPRSFYPIRTGSPERQSHCKACDNSRRYCLRVRDAQTGIIRRKRPLCRVCFNLSHRRESPCCAGCGLPPTEERDRP